MGLIVPLHVSICRGGKVVKNLRFRDMYTMGRTIGAGGFSVVKLAMNKATGEVWACKRMHLPSPGCSTNESGSSRDEVLKEIDILMSLDHPNIIYIKEYFEEESRVYIIMEYLEGGELLDVLINKGRYTEDDARVIFKQLIEGVRYLHGKGIVHRDLKLDNLLLTKPGNIHKIKIADFGLAKKYAQSSLSTICGTPHYIAPEVIKVSLSFSLSLSFSPLCLSRTHILFPIQIFFLAPCCLVPYFFVYVPWW